VRLFTVSLLPEPAELLSQGQPDHPPRAHPPQYGGAHGCTNARLHPRARHRGAFRPAAERLLACVGPSPSSTRLVRTGDWPPLALTRRRWHRDETCLRRAVGR